MARYEGLLAEILEGIDVAPHEGSHVGSQDESHVDGPGLAQHHHEGPDPVLAAILVNAGEAAPVHLCLLSRRGFKAYRGLWLAAPAAGPYVFHQSRVATLVSPGPQLPEQDYAVLQSFRQPKVHVLGVWVQLGPPRGPGLGLRHPLRPEVLPYRVAGKAQFPGNPPDGLPFSLHLIKLFHLSTPKQSLPGTSLRLSRTGCPQGPGVGQIYSGVTG